MKIKAVGAICGKVKQIVIHDQGSRQWIGDGMAAYALPDNFPEINESSACMLFDIETDKAADYYIRRQALSGQAGHLLLGAVLDGDGLPVGGVGVEGRDRGGHVERHADMPREALAGCFNVADDDDGEEYLDYDTDRRLIVDGKDLLPVSMPHRKTFFIQTKYLKPLKDAEQLQLFLRDAGPVRLSRRGREAELRQAVQAYARDLEEILLEGETLSYGENGEMIVSGIDNHPDPMILVVGTISDHTLRVGEETVSLRDLCGRSSKVLFTYDPG